MGTKGSVMRIKPKKHDVVVFDGRRGVVINVDGNMAHVYYSTPKSNEVGGHGWLHFNGLKVVARRRSQLEGDEPEGLRILEVRGGST